jgi:outer membrane protein assembly factor BamB
MQNTGQTDAAGPSGCVETQWSWSPNQQERLSAGSVVADGHVYIPHLVSDDTVFVVNDAKTGDQQWQYVNEEYPIEPTQTPTLVDNRLYLVGPSSLMNVDIRNRSLNWFHDASNHTEPPPSLGPPRVANGLVYAGAEPGVVFAIDSETGEHRWTYDIEGLPSNQIPEDDPDNIATARHRGEPYAPVAATEKRVYVTSWDFSLYALDALTGRRQWQFSLGSDRLDVMHAPVVVDGAVYTQTENAILYVLDAETGEQLWTFDEKGKATDGVSPIVDDASAYIVAGTSTENLFLIALDRENGSVQWEHPVGPPFQDPVADADTIYVDQGRYLHAIDKEQGEFKWKLRLNRALAAPVTIAGGAAYVATSRGTVYGVW